jgi:hypothetical protein
VQVCNDVSCSPLVSTPNVNNFLDIRSQIKGILATSKSPFSDFMFIFEVLKVLCSGVDGRHCQEEYPNTVEVAMVLWYKKEVN